MLEILLSVAILVILLTIVILALNPKKHFADSRNLKRKSHLNSLLNAVYQYSIDHNGNFPGTLNTSLKVIGSASSSCDILCGDPSDYSSESGQFYDSNQLDFSGGSFFATQWDNINSQLILTNAGRSSGFGIYSSKIFDSSNTSSSWLNFSYLSTKPYGKELPANNNSENSYFSGSANMSGNVLLFRMNEVSGETIYDYSGNNNHGSLIDLSRYQLAQNGVFKNAIRFTNNNITDNGRIVVPHNSSLNLGNNSTVCAWVNLSDYTQAHGGFIHKGNNADFSDSEYSLQVFGNGRRPIFDIVDSLGNDRYVQSSVLLNSNTWNHVCGTFDYNDSVKIYVNGVERGSLSWNSSWIPRQLNGTMQVGAQLNSGNKYGMKGLLDEVAVFNRTLSPVEILDFYHRGAMRIMYQFRSCSSNDCSGFDFIGPDGSSSSYYSEIDNNSNSLPFFNFSNLTQNRYFQYRIRMETINSSISPALFENNFNYLVPVSAELTNSQCLDLSPYLVPDYLSDIPFDPKTGDSSKTDYAIKVMDNSRIKIISCKPEGQDIISVSR